ncbi:DUF6675 family protein [Treponema sp.]|uniref:DUF6675 family protein n=1 Tax=Treponema sp. TaxID=166 RepID=UPI00388FB557
MKKLFIFMAAVAMGIGGSAFSYTARDIVGEENYDILKKEGKIQVNRFNDESNTLELLPDTEVSKKVFGGWKELNLTSMTGENLYLLPKNGTSIDDVSVILRAVSRLEGTEYYSNRKKRTEILYKNAYCIKDASDRTKVPDMTEGNADGQVQYCLLDDHSLGKTNYRISYTQTADEVAAEFTNVSSVSYGPVRAVSNGNLVIGAVFIDCGDEYLVYMAEKADFFSLGFLEDKIKKSLLSRLDAIYGCFMKQVGGNK